MADNEKTADGEQSYGASDITVLEGLEAVRKRPGMYIGSTGERGLHHLVYEVVDNSVDEALAGYADHIEVTIQADGGIKVVDNGRGIPVDEHPTEHKPTVEVVMTILHAGGKFGGGGYAVSGGLHGVGISVVNALSTRVNTEIRRQGYVWRMSFANGGTPITPLERGEATDETGTTQVFYPDPEIFETVEFDFETLRQRFQQMAFLNKGLRITLTDERDFATDEGDEIAGGDDASDKKTKGHRTVSYCYEHGLRDYVEYLDSAKKTDTINNEIIDFEADNDEGTMSVEIAMQWTTAYSSSVHTFANTINTTEGGMHEEGFRSALTSLVNRYGRDKGIIRDKDDNLTGDDVREGLTAVISDQAHRAPVRRPDEDQARQHRGPYLRRPTGLLQAHRLVRRPPRRRQGHHQQGSGRPGRPRRRPQGPRGHPPQGRARIRLHARQAARLLLTHPLRMRNLHRRGRLRRRLRRRRSRPRTPGHPADPRQDPQRRKGSPRPGPVL